MVGVSGFEPEEVDRKTVEPQWFSDFITFYHYIFAQQAPDHGPCNRTLLI